MKKNTGVIIAIAALLAVGVVGGTFAYFQSTATFNNQFSTDEYSTDIYEVFTPADAQGIEPGAEVNKDVFVENTGEVPILVRVKYTEKHMINGNWVEAQGNDRILDLKFSDCNTDWTDIQGDGYYYYKKILSKADEDIQHLDNVAINKDYEGSACTKWQYAKPNCGTFCDAPINLNCPNKTADFEKTQEKGYLANVNGQALDCNGNVTTCPSRFVYYDKLKSQTTIDGEEFKLEVKVDTIQQTNISLGDLKDSNVWGSGVPDISAWNLEQ